MHFEFSIYLFICFVTQARSPRWTPASCGPPWSLAGRIWCVAASRGSTCRMTARCPLPRDTSKKVLLLPPSPAFVNLLHSLIQIKKCTRHLTIALFFRPLSQPVLRHGQAFSPIYRFSLSDGTIVSAHTKSKLVRSPATNEPQLYMSLHILQRYVLLLYCDMREGGISSLEFNYVF